MLYFYLIPLKRIKDLIRFCHINKLVFSFSIAILFLSGNKSFAQDEQLMLDTVSKDSIIEVAETVYEFSIDSLKYKIEDLSTARIKDSLWLEEIYSSSLFEEMYTTILDESLEESEINYPELTTELLKERLEELNKRTPFRVEYNPSLENIIKHYLKNRRTILERQMSLSRYYFPMFEEILDKHDLPLELKYLAIVESALNPRAKSRVGATGLWQFMFTTGKMFDLNVSSYVDERSDPLKSTEAASKYLKSLNNSFNDWDLALAAYNSGPGNVSKAIRRSGGKTDYWQLRNFLPRETAGYVPAFLATMYIFEFAEEHGFKNIASSHIPYMATDTIRVKNQITLEQVSKLTNLDMKELEFLNPAYKLGIIPVIEGRNYVLRLPVMSIGKFVTNEKTIYEYAQKELEKETLPKYYEQPERIRYRVKNGDYLGKIAQKYRVGVSQIKRWNGLKSNNIRAGQYLTIYPRADITQVANTTAQSTAQSTHVNTSGEEKIYTVKAGDTLWSISRKFPGVSIEKLQKWNGISGTNLKPGTKLKIPQS